MTCFSSSFFSFISWKNPISILQSFPFKRFSFQLKCGPISPIQIISRTHYRIRFHILYVLSVCMCLYDFFIWCQKVTQQLNPPPFIEFNLNWIVSTTMQNVKSIERPTGYWMSTERWIGTQLRFYISFFYIYWHNQRPIYVRFAFYFAYIMSIMLLLAFYNLATRSLHSVLCMESFIALISFRTMFGKKRRTRKNKAHSGLEQFGVTMTTLSNLNVQKIED